MLPVREFQNAEEMQAHYRALQTKSRPAAPVVSLAAVGRASNQEIKEKADTLERLLSQHIAKWQAERECVQAEMDALRGQLIQTRQELAAVKETLAILCVDFSASEVEESAAGLMRAVAAASGIPVASLRSKIRSEPVAKARHIACWLIRTVRAISVTEIGRMMKRDHTTVVYGCWLAQRVASRLGIDPVADLDGAIAALWAADWSEDRRELKHVKGKRDKRRARVLTVERLAVRG